MDEIELTLEEALAICSRGPYSDPLDKMVWRQAMRVRDSVGKAATAREVLKLAVNFCAHCGEKKVDIFLERK